MSFVKSLRNSLTTASPKRRSLKPAQILSTISTRLAISIKRNKVTMQRAAALFFVGAILLQSMVLPLLQPQPALAQSISKGSKDGEPAQLNTDYSDPRVKKQSIPETIKSKDANFTLADNVTKKMNFAKVENSTKTDKPKFEFDKNPDLSNVGNLVEIPEKRSSLTSVYKTATGKEVEKTSIIPVNYQDQAGKWQKVDFASNEDQTYANRTKTNKSLWQTVVDAVTFRDSQPKSYKNDGGNIKTDFQTLSVGGVQYRTDKGSFAINPTGAGVVQPQYLKDKSGLPYIKYQNVWDGVDVMYDYLGTSVKQYTIINKMPKSNQFRFKLEGARVRNVDGHIELEEKYGGEYAFADLSLRVGKNAEMTNPPIKQYASADGTEIIVELDNSWMRAQPRDSFPMVIDPQFVSRSIPGGIGGDYSVYKSDGYVGNSANHRVNVGGINDGGLKGWRSIINLPYDHITPDKTIVAANISMQMMTNPEWTHGYTESRSIFANWASCFGYNCVGSPGADNSMVGQVSTGGSVDVLPLMKNFQDSTRAGAGYQGRIMLRGEDWWAYNWKELDPRLVSLNTLTNSLPNQISPLTPSSDPNTELLVSTSNPQLSVTPVGDPDGDPVNYAFRLYSSAGQQLWDSGFSASPNAVVPDGIVEDGSSYTWRAQVADLYNGQLFQGQTEILGGKLKLKLRTGKDVSQSYDQLGPVNINVATGNATTAIASHTMSALGGNIGLDLTYNSPLMAKQGLTGEYYNATTWGSAPVYVRTDPNINFNWAIGSPAPGVVSADNFLAKWKGYFIAPYTGNFSFGSSADDGMQLYLDDNLVLSNTCCGGATWSNNVAMRAGEIHKVEFRYQELGGGASINWLVKSDVDPTVKVVPSEWLRTAPQQTKPFNGLTGHYYNDSGNHDFNTNKNQFLTRTDKTINFDWGTGSVSPGAPADKFLARWEGYFTAPMAGVYKFGTGSDDGSRLWVNGQSIVDRWTTAGNGDVYGAPIMLNAGQTVPIRMEYFEEGGSASAKLLMDGPGAVGPIPTQFLSPGPQVVPPGWNLSADTDGNLAFERISIRQNGDVGILDADGSERVFTNTGSGYKPPLNESAILVQNDDSSYTLTDSDGRTYVFNPDGTLKLTTTPPDDRSPAALLYEYSTQNGVPKLKKIIDGVDPSRYGTLLYDGETSCSSGAPLNFSTLSGQLCAFVTSDGQRTDLTYTNGQISRIQLPGSATYDIGYDTNGMITSLRDVSANDAIAAGVRSNDTNVLSELAYDDIGRVKTVTGPKPDASLARPQHTLEYLPGKTRQHITGAPEPNGYVQEVSYDNLLRTTKLCDNRLQCSTTEWDPTKDLVLSSTNPSGMKSTKIYDSNDMPIRSYGPAPASWYGADRKPIGLNVFNIPNSEVRYDEGINGAAVAYFDYHSIATPTGTSGVLFGAPKVHTTGINANPSLFIQNWTSPPIVPSAGMEGWGMTATGLLSFATAGDYTFTLTSNDGVRLWVDDAKVIDDWKAGTSRARTYKLTAAAGKSYRFHLDSFDLTDATNASLNVTITPPGGTATNNLSSYLKPGYYLKTSAVGYDYQAGTITTKTAYGNPAVGLATASSIDPAGLNLTSTQSYEAPGTGFLRETKRTEPSGSGYNYIYYGASETADNPCTSSVEAYHQAGMLKGKTNPGGTTSTMVYDAAGRIVAVKANADPWTCTSYDLRGRATKVVVPSIGSRPGRTTETFFSYGNNPLVTAVNDTAGGLTLNETDLMGRTVRSVDSYANETKITYNDLGQVTKRTSPLGTEDVTYDTLGSVASQKLDGLEYAKSSYDNQGRIAGVQYLQTKNTYGFMTKLNNVKRDALGRVIGNSYGLSSFETLQTTDTFSQGNRLTAEQITYKGKTVNSNYAYDGAGRLTAATVDSWKFNYGYGAEGTTCSDYIKANPLVAFIDNANAGKNSNMTSQTITNTVNNQGKTTENCYGKSDRLYKSSDDQIGSATYDDHGNTTSLAGGGSKINLAYDATDRNTFMAQGDYMVQYTRSADGTIIAKKEFNKNKLTSSYRYYAGGSVVATCSLANANQCTTSERTLTLPGNVSLAIRANQPSAELAKTYSIKNQKGEAILSTTSNGKAIGTVNLYNPFGGQLYGSTFNTASDLILSKGLHITLNISQYGKRLYVASIGRFLQVDPVEGGTANDYAYVSDPTNSNDFNGARRVCNFWIFCHDEPDPESMNSAQSRLNPLGMSVGQNQYNDSVDAGAVAGDSIDINGGMSYRFGSHSLSLRRNLRNSGSPGIMYWSYGSWVTPEQAQINSRIMAAQAASAAATSSANIMSASVAMFLNDHGIMSAQQMAQITVDNLTFFGYMDQVGKRLSEDAQSKMGYRLLDTLLPGLGVAAELVNNCSDDVFGESCVNTIVFDAFVAEIAITIATGGATAPEFGAADGAVVLIGGPSIQASLNRIYYELNTATNEYEAIKSANYLLNNKFVYSADDLLARYNFNGTMSKGILTHLIEGDASGGAHLLEGGGIDLVTSMVIRPTLASPRFDAYILKADGNTKFSSLMAAGTSPEAMVKLSSEASYNIIKSGNSVSNGEFRWIGRASDGTYFRFTSKPSIISAGSDITSVYNFHENNLKDVEDKLLN